MFIIDPIIRIMLKVNKKGEFVILIDIIKVKFKDLTNVYLNYTQL